MGYLYCDLHGCALCDLDDDVREECDVEPVGCSFCDRCSFVVDSVCNAPASQV